MVCPISALFLKAPPKVPVKLERTQKDKVIGCGIAVPHAKSAVLKPSIGCSMR
jgi:hypothetical protein